MLTDKQINEIRKRRASVIKGPATQEEWNEKMFQRPFTGPLFFEVKVLKRHRVHFPCHISTQGKKKRIQLDTGYAGLSANETGEKYLESLGYSVSKGLISKDFPKLNLKAVIREYIQSMIDDIDAIGPKGFKNYL